MAETQKIAETQDVAETEGSAGILGYNNWVCTQLWNKSSSGVLFIRQANCGQGKFYRYDNKDNSLADHVVNEMTAAVDTKIDIAACSRESSPSGTYGSLFVYDNANRKVCKVTWDVPYGAINKCKYTVTEQHADYVIGPKFIDKPNGLGNGGPGAYVGRVEIRVVYVG